MNFYGESHVGAVRKNNEDRIYVSEKEPFIFAVCDGMGGEAFGEKAATIAVAEIENLQIQLQNPGAEISACVNEYVKRVNTLVCEEITRCGQSMGTTLVLLCIKNGHAYFYNIGDSRAYILRDGVLSLLSQDHTITGGLVRMGIITKEQALIHPDKNKLTQCIGTPEDKMRLEIYQSQPVQIKAGDVFLLCSDGLTEMCSDDETAQILSQHKDAEPAAKKLISRAIKNGGHDNISVIVAGN